jgi:hypothetical protein
MREATAGSLARPVRYPDNAGFAYDKCRVYGRDALLEHGFLHSMPIPPSLIVSVETGGDVPK